MPIYQHLTAYLDMYESVPAKAIVFTSIGEEFVCCLNTRREDLLPEEKFKHENTLQTLEWS
jgi:hypothetical protein